MLLAKKSVIKITNYKAVLGQKEKMFTRFKKQKTVKVTKKVLVKVEGQRTRKDREIKRGSNIWVHRQM